MIIVLSTEWLIFRFIGHFGKELGARALAALI